MQVNTELLISLYLKHQNITKAAREYCSQLDLEYSDSFRRKCSKIINREIDLDDDLENTTQTITQGYEKPNVLTAYNKEGQLMDIEEFCDFHGLDKTKVKSYKLVTHTGIPFFNVAFHEEKEESSVSLEELKDIISEGLEGYNYEPKEVVGAKTGIVKIADLHLGSYIDNLIRTKEFSISILAEKLNKSAEQINRMNYEKVHVQIYGDLIESFTGLNHKNSWKGLDKGMVGAEAVKMTCKILHKDFLNKISNLDEIKIVAGNHDRTTSDNKEDVQGDAANLISWGLELMGYNVEFHPLVITHVVDGICHIMTHGHHGISKKSTKQLCWDYGRQGMFNLICEGHLHSVIEKLSIRQLDSFQITKDDAVDHRRINLPSFFTGNFFSEALGYTSQSGFVIVEDNGEGVPNVFYYSV